MITIKLFKTVITISSIREELRKEINYNYNVDLAASIREYAEKCRDERIQECLNNNNRLLAEFGLIDNAAKAYVLDDEICRKKNWYTIDTKKLKFFDVIKTKISF